MAELAERLTGAMAEGEVVRILADEIQRRVRPTHWCLLLGDRDQLRVEHVGGHSHPSLLRRRVEPTQGPVWRALESFETQVEERPDPTDLLSLQDLPRNGGAPEDAVALPFGGFEVVGCLEMVDALRFGPAVDDLNALRRALRLAGVGIRNARRHLALAREEGMDEITGLYGPSTFRSSLRRELERCRRTERTVAMVMLDLDHFKKVNREHGALVGSSLLAEVGGILQLAVRRIDVASRWCGDTFALLLPETDLAGARIAAARIQKQLREASFDIGTDRALRLTASVGIAVFDQRVLDPDGLVTATESAMRAAQAAGELEASICLG